MLDLGIKPKASTSRLGMIEALALLWATPIRLEHLVSEPGVPTETEFRQVSHSSDSFVISHQMLPMILRHDQLNYYYYWRKLTQRLFYEQLKCSRERGPIIDGTFSSFQLHQPSTAHQPNTPWCQRRTPPHAVSRPAAPPSTSSPASRRPPSIPPSYTSLDTSVRTVLLPIEDCPQ